MDKKILDLASDVSNYGLKNKYKNFASVKNRKCGDKIKVELNIKNKIIKKMYYETESCIFCQASASVISKYVKDIMVKNLDKIETHKNFTTLINKKYIARKECVLLPYEALKKAINN